MLIKSTRVKSFSVSISIVQGDGCLKSGSPLIAALPPDVGCSWLLSEVGRYLVLRID